MLGSTWNCAKRGFQRHRDIACAAENIGGCDQRIVLGHEYGAGPTCFHVLVRRDQSINPGIPTKVRCDFYFESRSAARVSLQRCLQIQPLDRKLLSRYRTRSRDSVECRRGCSHRAKGGNYKGCRPQSAFFMSTPKDGMPFTEVPASAPRFTPHRQPRACPASESRAVYSLPHSVAIGSNSIN